MSRNSVLLAPLGIVVAVLITSLCLSAQSGQVNIEQLKELLRRAQKQQAAFKDLMIAQSLHCKFSTGSVTRWEDGHPIVEPGTMTSSADPSIFYQINTDKGTAKMMGNLGTTDLRLLSLDSGLTFVELTDSGNIIITSVFATYLADFRKFPAVHSRHFFAAGRALPSQYSGWCIVPE